MLNLLNKFFEHDIQNATHSLETLEPSEAAWILKSLPQSICVQAFHFMEPRHAARVISEFPDSLVKEIVEHIPIQTAGEIFLSLPAEEKQRFLDQLNPSMQKRLQDQVIYPENSAGRIMNPDFLVLHSNFKVKEAIQRIRSLHKKAPVNYVYVVDEYNKLVGVLNMRDLLLANPDTSLESVMLKDVFAVNASMDREEVALQISKKRFLAVPVVDNDHHILGTIKTEELLSYTQEEATEDIQKMFGAGGDEKVFSPIWFAIRKRLPWLYINLGTAFLAAFVIGLFENIIAQITMLAVFLPIVAGQGGNAGTQTLAIVIRGLALKEVSPNMAKRVIFKEGLIGIINGAAIGIVTALIAWLWGQNPFLGVIIGLAMIVNMVAAGVSGAVIPLTMKSLGWDPAQSSSIFLTTVTDVVGFASFLGFAVLFQQYLL